MSRLTERELDLIRRERQAAERETGPQGAAGFLTTFIVGPVRVALRRRRTFTELNRLDDRMLRDIGLERASLPHLADDLVHRTTDKPRQTVGLIARLLRWRRRQATINQLKALDDRSLEDIGMVRGNIAAAVDATLAAEDAARVTKHGVDGLLCKIDGGAPKPSYPLREDGSSLQARAMALRALQIASHSQAS